LFRVILKKKYEEPALMANLDKMEKMPKPAEWHFSQLLFNIAKNITEGELSTLKRMYKGEQK
jgi:hypothetical protein